jgi:ABC-2 type transport system ATP-binding protein
MPAWCIETESLEKAYGSVVALAGVDLQVETGSLVCVLGHNGAGKTTLIDILTTRSRATAGSARVCGCDVAKASADVRRRIAVTGQFTGLDEMISGRANLVLLGRLLGANRHQARQRADELIDSFGLSDAAGRRPSTYSGGMRRRLDLAAGLMGRPDVLFLDEPSTGLDPVGRGDLWAMVRGCQDEGVTVVLTTQDLQEAEQLASEVVVLAAGKVAVRGTPQWLKASIGMRTATITLANGETARRATAVLADRGLAPVLKPSGSAISVPLPTPSDVVWVMRRLDDAGLPVDDLVVSEPSLSDVYLSLHHAGWQWQ